ncbi:MAG: HEAT repeat domain-containing protein [Elusimicrobia bacterium]|nr:HEAT repeat domain-containing protein [Elusimicrobiota bacterium]
MPMSGWGASVFHARARYRTLILSAFCMACAVPLRAQAAPAVDASTVAPAEPASVAEGHDLVIRRDRGAKARLLALAAQETDPSAKAKLIYLLGNLPVKDLAPADFDAALADPDPGVRLAALLGLGRIPGTAAESRLVKALSDPNPGVRQGAAFWLGQAAHAGAAADLGRALTQDRNSDVRLAAAEALSRLGTTAARRELRRGANDPDPRVRRWAK